MNKLLAVLRPGKANRSFGVFWRPASLRLLDVPKGTPASARLAGRQNPREILGRLYPAAALIALLVWSFRAEGGRYDRSDDTRSRRPASVIEGREWGLDLEAGATLNRGNVNKTVETARFDVFRAFERVTTYLTAGYDYGDVNHQVYMQKASAIARVDYHLDDSWRIFALSTHGYNYFLKIAYRTTDGLGPWYDWTLGPIKNASSIAVAYEYETFRGFPSDTTVRLPFREVSTWDFSQSASLGLDFFFSPDVADFSNYRIFFGPYLETKLWEDVLSFRFQLALDYDTRPRPGVVGTDTETYVSLVLHLGGPKDATRPRAE